MRGAVVEIETYDDGADGEGERWTRRGISPVSSCCRPSLSFAFPYLLVSSAALLSLCSCPCSCPVGPHVSLLVLGLLASVTNRRLWVRAKTNVVKRYSVSSLRKGRE